MAVFITGGHGHIGSWTASYLAKEGEHVMLLDINPEPPDCLKGVSKNITFMEGDVLNFPHLKKIFEQHKGTIQGIIHTVGIMAEMVVANPYDNVRLNLLGTHHVLEMARLFDIEKVVYTSTGAVYGNVPGTVSEDKVPPNPSDLYGATKASCEFLGKQYANTFGFQFRIGRLSFCYGPGKFPSRFIRLYRMAFGALEGLENLQMDRGADQKLDFTYIEDAALGTSLLYKAKDLKHTTYNIATGIPSTVGRVAELAQKYSHFPVPVELGRGKLMERCEALDITRAREDLAFEPRFSLDQGIQAYAAWLAKAKSEA